jgi:drug/metabolite transporter (DMT)-like permease
MPFLIDLALQGLPPAELTAIRLLIAGLIMALLAGPRRLIAAIRANLTKFLVLALLGFTLPNLFFAAAMQTVPIPVVSFIANSYPALAMALAVVFLGERPTRLHVAGIACALVGLYLMAGVQPGQAIAPGIILVFLASLGWAVSSIASKKLTVTLASSVIVAGRHLLAGLLALTMMLVGGVEVSRATAATWAALLAMVGLSLISMQLYYVGLRRTTVSTASLLEAFTPAVTLTISALCFGESLSGVQLLAAGLVLLGSVLVTVQIQRRSPQAA